VQNSVERRELGVATATTGFFRALGGAVGAAVFGAIFVARAGATHPDVGEGVRGVFLAAAPIAAVALVVVLFLVELPLRGPVEGTRETTPGETRAREPSAG
jgi:MFS family permease